jgi:TusA-related sulfurtransferase
MQSDITLDALGLLCPIPIIKTAKKFKEMSVGQVLEVLSDDKGIKVDMPNWCKSTGNGFLGIEEYSEGEYKVYVKKLVED